MKCPNCDLHHRILERCEIRLHDVIAENEKLRISLDRFHQTLSKFVTVDRNMGCPGKAEWAVMMTSVKNILDEQEKVFKSL